ncbi:MAG TPA: DUF2203 domain-containing protein [Dehalococcoidia bacterium]|nr:DUF2203 domain-containing protein [Dehalococcoidia bacterium]
MPGRYFTVQEAEALLPQLTPILSELQAEKREADRLQAQLAELSEKVGGNGHSLSEAYQQLQQQAQKISDRAARLAQQINDYGCELKDINSGLLDFRTLYQGREVYLCWRMGEERIQWWHELDSGFAGRKPLQRELIEGKDES